MPITHYIDSSVLGFSKLQTLLDEDYKIALSEEASAEIDKARSYLNLKQKESKHPIYGVNTGFGSLCNIKINEDKLTFLQENLVMSHACGTGDRVEDEIVKLMLLLKIQSLSYGYSGVSIKLVERLIHFYNEGIFPVIYEQGSLGASGDLAPLAHLALPLLGKGEVIIDGKIESAKILQERYGWEPLVLQSKEGLALLNGTQFMSAHLLRNVLYSRRLMKWADVIAAVSIDAFDCNMSPFDDLVHQVRPHKGQIETAQTILKLLHGSEIAVNQKQNVQDPYSFRCVPQVHGATRDALRYIEQTLLTEINSVTDNPNVFVDEDKIISGGNFHGQPLAIAADFMAIAMSEIGNISERRIYQLVSGLRGLPTFLVSSPGLNSGFMIPQYTAASIVSQNKQLCTPASVDSIVSSNGQEDHVSMGANAVTKLNRVIDNIEKILAIELFNASQAMHFRRPLKSSEAVESILDAYKEAVPVVREDKVMASEIQKSIRFLRNHKI
ncbi:histidine ammonia-lyase [Psychroflexus montanilacus]|uniref:histidine ammonia-lyase n=1 Tax=Psychroflexus montanilacus TaxID=2873598 RepID=UPI001CCFCD17|nr:histidine ammonia-lyase [Psychroflexus montanilacus]MBZ9650679.1 histidine ammonia-lyase [Psychroflexus montanilacus]